MHVQRLRAERNWGRLEQAKVQATWEKTAIVAQRIMRGHKERKDIEKLRRNQEQKRFEMSKKESCALHLQRIKRGLEGRRIAEQIRSDRERFEKCWLCTRHIQSIWRGMKGRERYRLLATLKKQEQMIAAALDMQRIWRGRQGKQAAMIAKSIERLQAKEKNSAITIQRIYRGKMGYDKSRQRRMFIFLQQTRTDASIKIQRIFRGHKGRENFAVAIALRSLEHKARPLYSLLENEGGEIKRHQDAQVGVKRALEEAKNAVSKLEKEIAILNHTNAKYWDSDQITGTPQRYVTGLLRVSNIL